MAGSSSKHVAPWGGTFQEFADLRQVFALAKKHSNTLGFLPNAAFTDRARRGGLLLAWLDGVVVGYCLFDIHRAGHIKLVHVCVDEAARGSGLGKDLIDEAVKLNPHSNGVLADCRRDYQMDRFWRSVGMDPKGERPGRARGGSTLVRWWRPLGALDLFEEAALSSGLPLVCIDSNIVSDLYGLPETVRPDRDASLGLVADWLDAAVVFAVSPQVDHEMNRIEDPKERTAQRSGAGNLVRLRTTRPNDRTVEDELIDLIGDKQIRRDKSLRDDVEHIADAIRAGADYFVTNDINFIRCTSTWLFERYDIEALRPHQLITQLQAKLSQPVFQSSLIESVDLTWVPASNVLERDLEASFIESPQPAKEFRRLLHALLADPAHTTVRALIDEREKLWALYATRVVGADIDVPLLRVVRGSRSTTVALQLARYLRRLTVKCGASRITVSDTPLAPSVVDALRIDGFDVQGSSPVASVLATVATESSVEADQPGTKLDTPESIVQTEIRHWPLMIVTDRLPCYLVPIQPRWAERLFGFPNDALFHVRKTELGLSREHVYFNGGNQLRVTPARLLWYVTVDKSNALRQLAARSRLIESVLLSPDEAHRRFGHLGVLSLREISQSARKDGLVNVIRFADTELLEPPYARSELRPLFDLHDVKGTIQSTREVSPAMFNDVIISRFGDQK